MFLSCVSKKEQHTLQNIATPAFEMKNYMIEKKIQKFRVLSEDFKLSFMWMVAVLKDICK